MPAELIFLLPLCFMSFFTHCIFIVFYKYNIGLWQIGGGGGGGEIHLSAQKTWEAVG